MTAVRYNNNAIHELNDLMTTMSVLVVNPVAISWLDFSFNDIHQLDDVSSGYSIIIYMIIIIN